MNNVFTPTLVIPFLPIRIAFTFKLVWILLAFSLLVSFAISIVQLNSYIKEVYLINDYQLKIGQLTQGNKALEVSYSKGNSLNNMTGYAAGFVKADKIEYIRLLDKTVAAKVR